MGMRYTALDMVDERTKARPLLCPFTGSTDGIVNGGVESIVSGLARADRIEVQLNVLGK